MRTAVGAGGGFARVSSKLFPLANKTCPRYFHLHTRRPSPHPDLVEPAQFVVPKSLFPNTTAQRIRNGRYDRRQTVPRFVLVHDQAVQHSKDHPAITVLKAPNGMLCYVQVVSTPTADTPGGCLVLHFDNRRYLFGRMAEGTQRHMIQRKISLARIHDIFLTGSIDWDATGGLLGMILTIADLKASSVADVESFNEARRNKGKKDIKAPLSHLNIHGGKNLVHLLATARRFILRKALPVYPRELRHDPRAGAEKEGEPDYEDENIRVWSIPLSKEQPAARSPDHQSHKKRKLDTDSDGAAGAEELASEEADQNIRESVVKDMFCSKWNLDTLREMRLADVQMPAKIFVRNDEGHLEPYEGPDASEAPDTRVLVRLPWPAAKIEQLPATTPSKQSMSYIVKGHTRRGKFDPVAAVNFGVDKRDNKLLTSGQSVKGKDGITVTPEMVMGPSMEGHGFAVVDIPSEDLIDELLERREWSNSEIMQGIDVMYWILPGHITLDDPKLQRFIQARPSIKHTVLSSAVCPNIPALESPTSQLIKMNHIDGERFHLPVFSTKPSSTIPKEVASLAEVGRSGQKFQLAPNPKFISDAIVPVMDTKRPFWEMSTRQRQVFGLVKDARRAVAKPAFLDEVERSQQDLPCPEAEIIPLGTGSAMPSKYRNVSATLVRVPGWGSYLLDCGENTLGQLRRCFGHSAADSIIKDLRAICISHAHADHHLGTISVTARWLELSSPDKKLAIVATPKYQDFIREFHQVQNLDPSRLVPITLRSQFGRPQPGATCRTAFPPDVNPTALGLPTIEACFVDHCYEATALVLTFPDTGLKVAYSGDCRPSAAFADLARGATLLIHECTFDDELGGDAIAKKHSTLGEALDVGRRMEARRILLTHFSQRYPKLPTVNDRKLKAGTGRDVEVLFAFDMMRVKLGEFKQAKAYLPALRELLQEGERDDGEEI
jgi:ribonuclease Z